MKFISSDTFNPMLVRDLRQGLRSSLFTAVFLILQGCMAYFVVMGLISGNQSDVGNMLVHSLTFAVLFFYLIGLPMLASFALSPEFRENRIDLLKLTQMSARSLVWGKWLSLIVQGLMVITSLLPYIILMYFFGGVDLAAVFVNLGFLLVVSALLVGLCVSLSSSNSAVFRGLGLIGLIFIAYMLIQSVSFGGPVQLGPWFFGAGISSETGIVAALFVVLGIPTLWLLLEFGAFRLGPASENHDTLQRLVLFLLVAVAGVSVILEDAYPRTVMEGFTTSIFGAGSFLAIWIMIFAAASDPSPYPDTYRPFVHFGWLGRFMGRVFLYPGWPSSAPFIMLASACYSLLLYYRTAHTGDWANFSTQATTLLLLPSAILFPQVLGWLILRKTRSGPGARYFVAVAMCVIVWIIFQSLYLVFDRSWILALTAILPPTGWILLSTKSVASSAPAESLAWWLAGISSTLTMLVVCTRALRHWKTFTALEQLAGAKVKMRKAIQPPPPKESAPAPASPPKGPTWN